jgi:hypothetical protein
MNVNAVYPGTFQDRHLEELGLHVESRSPRRCSRVRPAVYTDGCPTEDIHRIMVEYFRFKKQRDRWNKARRKVRYPLRGCAGNAEATRFASR